MEKVTSKCKNCGSELWFNPQKGTLDCRYCQTNYFLPTKNDKAVLVRQYDAGFHPNQLNKTLFAYKCDTCKNIYYMSSEEKSKKCPNCGNLDQTKMNVARRTCGYIGSQFWNQGRTQEIKDRVLHL